MQPRLREAPYVLLAVLGVASVGVRSFRLEQPCEHSCGDPAAASLIFDEAYYVNAARRIDGVAAAADQPSYARAPSGTDADRPENDGDRDRDTDRPGATVTVTITAVPPSTPGGSGGGGATSPTPAEHPVPVASPHPPSPSAVHQ